jgi:C1A family cysteine protease
MDGVPIFRRFDTNLLHVSSSDQPILAESSLKDLRTRRFPESFSLRNGMLRTSVVYDQGSCGACYAVAAAGMVSDIETLRTGVACRPDWCDIVDTCKDGFCSGCNGGDVITALRYISNHGVPVYGHPKQRIGLNLHDIHYIGNRTQWQETQMQIKEYLHDHGPVVGVFVVYSDFEDAYPWASTDHVYVHGSYGKTPQKIGGHALLIYGWKNRAWICKNSWSTAYGDEGFIRIAMSDLNTGVNAAIGLDIPTAQRQGGAIVASRATIASDKLHVGMIVISVSLVTLVIVLGVVIVRRFVVP